MEARRQWVVRLKLPYPKRERTWAVFSAWRWSFQVQLTSTETAGQGPSVQILSHLKRIVNVTSFLLASGPGFQLFGSVFEPSLRTGGLTETNS